MDINDIINQAVKRGSSDIHLISGHPPIVRTHGQLVALDSAPTLNKELAKELTVALMNPSQKELFEQNKEIDFAHEHHDGTRLRINAYHQQGNVAAALRILNNQILSIDQLKLPAVMHQITNLKQGFVLMTGPTGSGKSTSLAAMIDEINQSRSEHIITIEDPIEYVYKNKRSIISQRELHVDTHSWNAALRSVLREDPDVALVGEMRDFETISSALTVAETGHLVFATLHTNSASQTIDRIIDVFPENQQPQVRNQLAGTIEAIFAQRLVPAITGERVPVVEILLASPAVKNTIREGKTYQIDNIIQTSGALGMMSFEASLVYWVKAGVIDMQVAKEYALRPDELTRMLKQ